MTIVMVIGLIVGLSGSARGELIWDADIQGYIEAPVYEAAPPVVPCWDNAELLWDETHDTDGDDLYGNYSNLAAMLPGWGINATQLFMIPISAATLAGYDILVLIDNEGTYTNQEVADIQAWINGGGKLLMIGENWGAFNPTQNNLVIAPYGIQFYDAPGYTTGSSNFAPHPITAGLSMISWAAGDAVNVSAPAAALAWDNSNQYTIAINQGGGIVLVMCDSNMMDNSTIGNNNNTLCMQNVMNYLGISYAPFDVVITLTPVITPIVIPAGGGTFEYDLTISNNDTFAGIFDGWIYAILPTGGQTGNVLQRIGLQIGSGASIIREGMTQTLPAIAPSGLYYYVGCAGELSINDIYSADSLEFTKSAAEGQGSVEGWALYGWDNEVSGNKVSAAKSNLRISGANPFNPMTSISFEIGEAAEISLKVFNISGQMVTELVEGYTEAGIYEVKFDGSNLSSGVYFVRLYTGAEVRTQKVMLLK